MEKTSKYNPTVVRVISLIIGATLSILVIALSLLTITYASENDLDKATLFLLWVFIILGVIRLITFIKEPNKITFARFAVLFILDVALGIIVLYAKSNEYLFSLTAGLYCLTIVIGRIFRIIGDSSPRNIVLNSIIILAAVLAAVGLLIPTDANTVSVVTIECTLMATSAIFEVVAATFSKLKLKVLIKIIFRTYALEVLFGLLASMIAFSLVLMRIEPTIDNFPDALWYSFAVVTTIGFGDFAAETPTGRILTVILGLYGIVVVAIITSIIVNFYNETEGKKDSKEFKDIKDEAESDAKHTKKKK
ncbi:MAG: two pore domain potassium channel family protein [Bacilli bacterium]|nr:two pore domain potassium channel family protein [Bacilli bacterium]